MALDDTLVRSVCPSCGPVELVATQLTVLLAFDGTPPHYRYTCPSCTGLVEKVTSSRAVVMLQGVGAHIVFVPAAQQPPVRRDLEQPVAAQRTRISAMAVTSTITPREIREFRQALDQTSDIAAAAGGGSLS